MANKHPVLCNGVQSDKLMMVDLTNTKLIETGLKSYERDTRGLFCSKTRTKYYGTGGDDTVVVN